jgi:hypothetical protein
MFSVFAILRLEIGLRKEAQMNLEIEAGNRGAGLIPGTGKE